MLRSGAEDADTVVWLPSAPEPGHCSGMFRHDRAPRPAHHLLGGGEDPSERAALWSLCEDATVPTRS